MYASTRQGLRDSAHSMFSSRDVFVALCLRHSLLPLSPINCVLTRMRRERDSLAPTFVRRGVLEEKKERERRKRGDDIARVPSARGMSERANGRASRPVFPLTAIALSKDLSSAPAPRAIGISYAATPLFFFFLLLHARYSHARRRR